MTLGFAVIFGSKLTGTGGLKCALTQTDAHKQKAER